MAGESRNPAIDEIPDGWMLVPVDMVERTANKEIPF